MKKILSIVIAAVMLLAISVPAFAATATIDQSTSGCLLYTSPSPRDS